MIARDVWDWLAVFVMAVGGFLWGFSSTTGYGGDGAILAGVLLALVGLGSLVIRRAIKNGGFGWTKDAEEAQKRFQRQQFRALVPILVWVAGTAVLIWLVSSSLIAQSIAIAADSVWLVLCVWFGYIRPRRRA
jgi:hypothetical protein